MTHRPNHSSSTSSPLSIINTSSTTPSSTTATMTMPTTTMMMYPCHYLSSISGYALGLLFIFIVAIIWALASVLVQYLYNDTDFDAPFLLTYIGTSLFTVLLPLHWLCSSSIDQQKLCCTKKTEATTTANANARIRQNHAHGHGHVHATSFERRIHDSDIIQTDDDDDDDDNDESYHDEVDDETDDDDSRRLLQQQQPQQPQPQNDTTATDQSFSAAAATTTTPVQKWTNKDHMVAAAKIAPMWFISNFAYNASLRYTSITSSTVLVNMGSLFTFLFAVMMRDEHFNWYKVVGVACGIGGSILTGLHDYRSDDDDNELLKGDGDGNGSIFMDNNPDDDIDDGSHQQQSLGLIWGDVLSVISAVFYGVYAVMVRVLCPHDESLMSMQLFLGYVGLWNMIALGPIAIYHIAGGGGDNNASSSTLSLWIVECLVLKGLFDNVISDYLWARAVVLTSATVATVGLGLTIPLAFVSDVFLGRPDVLNFVSVIGAVAVLAGFILVNLGQKKDDDEYNPPHPHRDDDNNLHGVIRRTTLNERELASPSSILSSSSYHDHDQELPEVTTTSSMTMTTPTTPGRD